MRLLSFLALSCAALHVVSALPLSRSSSGVLSSNSDPSLRDNTSAFTARSVQTLEARARRQQKVSKKPKPAPPPQITFYNGDAEHDAVNSLNNLNLHANKRKIVEDYHKKVVEEHMKTIPGAHSAVITKLAHSLGSQDPYIHITAEIKDIHGNIIGARRRGNPKKIDPKHHIYTNKEDLDKGADPLPIEYKKAVNKKRIREGKEPGHF